MTACCSLGLNSSYLHTMVYYSRRQPHIVGYLTMEGESQLQSILMEAY